MLIWIEKQFYTIVPCPPRKENQFHSFSASTGSQCTQLYPLVYLEGAIFQTNQNLQHE